MRQRLVQFYASLGCGLVTPASSGAETFLKRCVGHAGVVTGQEQEVSDQFLTLRARALGSAA